MEMTHDKDDHETDANGTPHADKKITVSVAYNGVSKSFDVPPQAAVESLLAQAIAAFGTHQLVLGWPDGRDVDMSGSIAHAGITEGTTLLLRPDKVRGGGE